MYRKLMAAIAATVMITALFASLGIAGVKGSSSSTDLVSSSTVQANQRLKFTISVTNESSENIENVLIRPPEGTLSEPIGGQNNVNSLLVAADNLENAVSTLNKLSDNIQLAADNIETAKTSLSKIKSNLEKAADRIGDSGPYIQSIVSGYLFEAAFAIGDASTALDEGDFSAAAENLKNAGENIREAGELKGRVVGTRYGPYTTSNYSFQDDNFGELDWDNYASDGHGENVYVTIDNYSTEENMAVENVTVEDSTDWTGECPENLWVVENVTVPSDTFKSGPYYTKLEAKFKVDSIDNVKENVKVILEKPRGENMTIYENQNIDTETDWVTVENRFWRGNKFITESGTYKIYLKTVVENTNIPPADNSFSVETWWDNAYLSIETYETPQYALQFAGESLENAGTNLNNGALGSFAENLSNAIGKLQSSSDNYNNTEWATLSAASGYMNNAIEDLETVQTAFADASGYLSDAGTNLTTAYVSLDTAADNLHDVTNLEDAGSALTEAAGFIGEAGGELGAPQDLFTAADELSSAADELANVGENLGKVLGESHFLRDNTYLATAAENMKSGAVDLSTASGDLVKFATELGSAADKIRSTANDLAPANWTLHKGDLVGKKKNDVVFRGIGDNVIAPGSMEEFTYLWKTPDIAKAEDYDLETWVYRDNWYKVGTLTVSVEGTIPTIEEIAVTQEGVTENNLVGDNYQDGIATVRIEFSEELSSIGDVTVENSTDNLLPPLSLTTADNITFVGTFKVGEWDAYNTVIEVASATDIYGNDNTSLDNGEFTVDTRAPVFLDNGLPGLRDDMDFEKLVAGTDNVWLTDNTAAQRISGNVEDNWSGSKRLNYENYVRPTVLQAWVSWNGNEVEVGDVIAPDNGFAKDITLSQGLNDVTVKATDWTGNTVSYTLENMFIDNDAPEVEFDSVGGQVWDDNAEPTSDNTPKISLTISDAGLGVAEDNLRVWFDGDENILNNTLGTASWASPDNGVVLDNATAYEWDAIAGQETFENTIDNRGNGLSDNTYWINVVASDNIAHNGSENVIFSRSFKIYTGTVAAPENVKPEGFTGDTTPTFEWNVGNSRTIVSYELVADNDPDYSSPVIEETIENADVTSFTPESALEPSKYYVKVTANYDTGQSKSTETTFNVGAAKIELEKGWNMISMPVLPDNATIRSVLSGLQDDVSIDNVVKVWSYDSATDSWKTFKPGAPAKANDLKTMKAMKGYWVKMETAATLRVPGTQLPKAGAAMPTETLHKGWNLVGFKSTNPMKRKEYLGDTIEDVTAACYEYNTASDSFEAIGPDEELQPGQAYWIAVTEQVTLYP